MNTKKDSIILSPHIPTNIFSNSLYVVTEGNTRSFKGSFPLAPFAFSDLEKEELSWHDNCYIHSGLNPFIFFKVVGKEFLKLLEDVSISTFKKFPAGKARHTILCNEKGKILMDGIVVRRSEEEFITMCLPDPKVLNQMNGNKYQFECEDMGDKYFFYQLCGPRSLEIVEAATQSDLHDIKFMYTKDTKIAGKDVFVLRTGMAGTLGYEVHGKMEDALEIYNVLMEKGKEFGITPIGRHAYRNTHTEGSIPQMGIHFSPAMIPCKCSGGSLDENSDYFNASPIDVGWEKMINFNHEFPGKAALKAELEGHHNTLVHLIWNKEDILKVIATYFEKGNSCEIMEMAEDFDYINGSNGVHIDGVYDGEKLIGSASGRMLSMKFREMMSLSIIDQDYAVEGKEVEVLWGTPGTRQMRIRANVTLAPYIKEGRNESFDVEQIPHPKMK